MHIVKTLDLGCAEVADLLHGTDLLGSEAVECAFLELPLIHLVNGERELDVEGYDSSVNLCYDAVALALEKEVNRVAAHFGSGESVAECGGSAANDVCETCKLGFDSGLFLNHLAEILAVGLALSVEYALGNNNEHTSLARVLRLEDTRDSGVLIKSNLGDRNSNRTRRDTRLERDLAAVTSHNLNHVATRVRLTGVAKLIDSLKSGVHSGIKADGVVGCGDIVVDRAGNADGGDTVERKIGRAAEGSVAADSNDSVDIIFLTGLYSLLNAFLIFELVATVGKKNSTAKVFNIGYGTRVHINDLALDKSAVAADDALYLKSVCKRTTGDSTNSAVHAGSITARGENADGVKFFHSFLASCRFEST